MLGVSDRKRITAEDELLLQTITSRERNLISVFRKLNEDNQDIYIGEIKKALKEQLRDNSISQNELREAK